jgi:hypothetical protein
MLYHCYNLADLARAMAAGRDVLSQGTQSSKAILEAGKLYFAAIVTLLCASLGVLARPLAGQA